MNKERTSLLEKVKNQEVMIIDEEKTKKFVRQVVGHLRGIAKSLEKFMLSTNRNTSQTK